MCHDFSFLFRSIGNVFHSTISKLIHRFCPHYPRISNLEGSNNERYNQPYYETLSEKDEAYMYKPFHEMAKLDPEAHIFNTVEERMQLLSKGGYVSSLQDFKFLTYRNEKPYTVPLILELRYRYRLRTTHKMVTEYINVRRNLYV